MIMAAPIQRLIARHSRARHILIALVSIALSACAAMQRPVLYPNAHLKDVGDATAQRDIDEMSRDSN
jgi:hypothetical protein